MRYLFILVLLLSTACPDPLEVGSACTSDTQCNDGICHTGMLGGYCTKECSDAECPGDSQCVPTSDRSAAYCLASCDIPRDCRVNYTCYDNARGTGVCLPSPSDAGAGSGGWGRGDAGTVWGRDGGTTWDAGTSTSTDAGTDTDTDAGTSTDAGTGVGSEPGYLYTKGSRILDSAGNEVRLTGLNWFGFEGPSRVPYGLDRRPLASILDQVKSLGYNTLRIPYSNDILRPGVYPNPADINYSTHNPGLVGLTSLQVLDQIIAGSRVRGMRVILDRHRPNSSGQSPLWYINNRASEEVVWIEDWKMLARRYKGNPTVVGVDLYNEPYGAATWGDGNLDTDWRLAAERAGNAILAENPHLLIIVGGIESHGGYWYWWGGNLRAARNFPVRLNVPGRLVYSTHDYPESVHPQSWFKDKPSTGYPANLSAVWDVYWGYLVKEDIAPVFVGEFGTKLVTSSDRLWLQSLTRYLLDNRMSFTFWCLNPNSDDTGGVLKSDWWTVEQAKHDLISPALAPFIPAP